MTRFLPAIAITIVLGLVLQPISFGQTTAAIEGVVRDSATGQPIADVKIGISTTGVTPIAYNPSQGRIEGLSATSDSQGRFSLTTVQTGRFRVIPTKDGYIYARSGQKQAPAEPGVWVQLSPGEHIRDLDLRMARPGTISGRVLDANGNPVIGTAGSVTLQRYSYSADGNRVLSWVPGIAYPGAAGSFQRMNDQGEFRFYDLPPGEYYLSVSGGGGAIGSKRTFFYPGVVDEDKAVPIRVVGGDEIKLGTLTLPPREKGVELKLRIAGVPPTAPGRNVYIGESSLMMTSIQNPNEVVLGSVAPGHYDIVLRTQSFLRTDPLLYAFIPVDVGATAVEQEITVKQGAILNGSVVVEDETGRRSPAPQTIVCRLRSRYGLENCTRSQIVPGPHEFDLQGLPPDMYLHSARIGDRDVLKEGLNITGDSTLDVVLATPGSIAQGIVRSADGEPLTDAVVALVPDAPYNNVMPRYRSVITDPNGRYEIHGIAPGSYKLFAWPELEGFAYRNAEFMKPFEDKGKPLTFEKGSRTTADLTAF